jgi:hypothetical protein
MNKSFKDTVGFFEGYNARYREEEGDTFGPERLEVDRQEWDKALATNEKEWDE